MFMYEAVFFDLDGTLYDKKRMSAKFIWAAFKSGCLLLLWKERRTRRRIAASRQPASYETLFAEISKGSCYSVDKVRKWYYNWYMPTMISLLEKNCTVDSSVLSMAEDFKSKGATKGKFLGWRPLLWDWLVQTGLCSDVGATIAR